MSNSRVRAFQMQLCPFPDVLIADASRDDCELYETALGSLVGGCVYAQDGRDALVKALIAPPSLLITDTQLPLISGYELCRLIRQDEATRRVPIVFVSSRVTPNELRLANRAGADLVLTKPCSPDTLRLDLEQLAEKIYMSNDSAGTTPAPAVKNDGRGTGLIARGDLKRSLARITTVMPRSMPPPLRCPSCDHLLQYEHTCIGGVNVREAEQWDYLACPRGCGRFQYRPRTRTLRRSDR